MLDTNRLNNIFYLLSNKTLVVIPTKNTKKYTIPQEIKHKNQAKKNMYLCEASLVIEFLTDKEAMKITKTLKKLAETASVNIIFKK